MNRCKKRYNKSSERNVTIQQDLLNQFKNKYILQTEFFDKDTVDGIIQNVSYLPSEQGNLLILELDNAKEITLKVRYGKAILDNNTYLSGVSK